MFPCGSTLNLAVPVAGVIIGGERLFPDMVAAKFISCAKTGTEINDDAKIHRDTSGVYLKIWYNPNCFNLRDIINDHVPESISLLVNIVKST